MMMYQTGTDPDDERGAEDGADLRAGDDEPVGLLGPCGYMCGVVRSYVYIYVYMFSTCS